jgi:hypothetical protein
MKDIHALLAQEPGLTPLDRVEHVLTSGYAHALALEAQQLRLERELLRLPAQRAASGDAVEAAQLTRRLERVEREHAHLRAVLVTLRDRARELRAA